MINRQTIPVGAIAANCSLLWQNPAQTVIVDPGADGDELVAFCAAKGLTPVAVLLTHAHFDHIGAIPALLKKWPSLPIHLAPADEPVFVSPLNVWPPEYAAVPRPPTLVLDLVDGAKVSLGGLAFTVLATPGHTPGSVCLLLASEKLLLSGDTLFRGSYGRTDFPGGSAEQMVRSLKRLAQLPPETKVVCGHGAGTTIAQEVASNPFMQ